MNDDDHERPDMPNHVINEVIIHDSALADVLPVVSSHDAAVDFSVLLPIPLNYWQGDENILHEKHMAGTGMTWTRENWGTKWNAYDLGPESVRQSGDDVVLTFQTAWNHPRGWVTALFNKTQKPITALWLSEGGFTPHREEWTPRSADGSIRMSWNAVEIAVGTSEYRRLHKLLWGVEEFEDEDAQ